jgi:hypothetical protein
MEFTFLKGKVFLAINKCCIDDKITQWVVTIVLVIKKRFAEEI